MDCEGPYVFGIQRLEIVSLQKLVQIDSEQLRNDADVLPKYYEVLDPQDVFAILDVLLFDLHQDIDLVQGKLHVITSCPHNLHRHTVLGLVVESLNHFAESPPS